MASIQQHHCHKNTQYASYTLHGIRTIWDFIGKCGCILMMNVKQLLSILKMKPGHEVSVQRQTRDMVEGIHSE